MSNDAKRMPVDTFALSDLPRVAPWVAEQIDTLGIDVVRETVADSGVDPDEPQRIAVWVAAVSRCRGRLWEVLDLA